MPQPHRVWRQLGAAARQILRAGAVAATGLCALGAMAWGTGALWYQGPGAIAWRALVLLLWLGAWVVLAGYAWQRRRLRQLWFGGLALTAALLLWWSTLAPQLHRPWADEVAHISQLQQRPDQPHVLEVQQLRNFDWGSDTDYTPRWETRRYDLRQLQSVDMALSYWMGPAIAHTLVSFGFADGQQLALSVEIRKERGEAFDALAGFFKRYELALIAADERDILAVRTNVRGEQVHLYRIAMPQATMQALLLAYAAQSQALQRTPQWYHTLTANCTTIVWEMVRPLVAGLPLDARLLASGYLPEYVQALGALTPGYALEALRAAGDITARAQQWGAAQSASATHGAPGLAAGADFSRAVRQGMPPLQAAAPAPATGR